MSQTYCWNPGWSMLSPRREPLKHFFERSTAVDLWQTSFWGGCFWASWNPPKSWESEGSTKMQGSRCNYPTYHHSGARDHFLPGTYLALHRKHVGDMHLQGLLPTLQFGMEELQGKPSWTWTIEPLWYALCFLANIRCKELSNTKRQAIFRWFQPQVSRLES